MPTPPTCSRCYKPTVQCSSCKGVGEVALMFGKCADCDGSGYRCSEHGKHWH